MTGFWETVSYVQMSKNRKRVLETLADAGTAMTPTELGRELGIVVKSASKAVRQLDAEGLVACRNPDAPHHREYQLTAAGQTILQALHGQPPAAMELAEQEPAYDEIDQELRTYIRQSDNRQQVLKSLDDGETPLTPTTISEKLEIPFNSTSRALRQLADHGLVRCVNPDAVRYRRYQLTGRGRAAISAVEGE